MTRGPDGRCDMPMNGNVIVTVTANESANGSGSVITVTIVTVVIVVTAETVIASASGSGNAAVMTMAHGVAADGKIANVPEIMTGNVVVEVTPVLLIRLEKYYDGEAADATRTVGGNDVSGMRDLIWHKATTAMNMKAVYDHHRPWEEHPLRHLRHLLSREALRKNDDLAVGETAIVSATEIERGIEITIVKVAAAAAAAVVIASVDEQETKEAMEMEEVEEECAWAVRANGLDGGCKINGMFQLTCVSFLVFHLILSTTLLLCSKLSSSSSYA